MKHLLLPLYVNLRAIDFCRAHIIHNRYYTAVSSHIHLANCHITLKVEDDSYLCGHY